MTVPIKERIAESMPLFLDELNSKALALCNRTLEEAELLDVVPHQIGGATVLDFAAGRPGNMMGGVRLAEICLAGLAQVDIRPPTDSNLPLPQVDVATDYPLSACIASQYAGWPFSHEKYFAMCSGPARMLRGCEDVLSEYQLAGQSKNAVGIFESNRLPNESAVDAFAAACHVNPSEVTICVARTASFPGSLQVVARSVETTLHKLHELHFDLSTIRSGMGSTPLPPLAADDLTALGWTNDSILYGASVNLWVETNDEAIEKILNQLPSSNSSDFGEPFLNIFNRYDNDFYKIDKMLFSPAQVVINNLKTGKVFCCGEVRRDILRSSFGIYR